MEEKGKTGETEETGKTGFTRLHGFPDLHGFPNKKHCQLSIINCLHGFAMT